MFYVTLQWSSNLSYQSRVKDIAESSRYDFSARIEYAYRDSSGNLLLIIQLIRIGSLYLQGVSPLISIETTSNVLSEPDKIWFTSYNIPQIEVSYSQPLQPSQLGSGQLSFTSCSTSGSLITVQKSNVFIKSLGDWVSLRDLSTTKIYYLSFCKLPLPPAPLGQLVIYVNIPSLTDTYVVISLWIMIGDKAYNIKNILYPNIY